MFDRQSRGLNWRGAPAMNASSWPYRSVGGWTAWRTGSYGWHRRRNSRHSRRAASVFPRRLGGPSHSCHRDRIRLAPDHQRRSTPRTSASPTARTLLI